MQGQHLGGQVVLAHELEEAVTDPDLNAWFDSKGYENADKCAWTFGTTHTVANGSQANMSIGGRDFLIQRCFIYLDPDYAGRDTERYPWLSEGGRDPSRPEM